MNARNSRTKRYQTETSSEKGATSVEYAVIIVLIILTVIGTVLLLVNPTDPDNSLLPKTYTTVSNKIGNFGTVTPPPE